MLNPSSRVRSAVTLAGLFAGLSLASESVGARPPSILGIPTLGGLSGEGTALNAAGVVTGVADTPSQGARAFTWQDRNKNRIAEANELVNLGTLGGTDSRAYSINASGQVVGESSVSQLFTHAFLFQDRNKNRVSDAGEMIDLGTLGGNTSYALDINNAGQVTGYSDPAEGFSHAFFFQDRNRNRRSDPGEMFDLGTLPKGSFSQGVALNGKGQVVGFSDSSSGSLHAFLFQDRNKNRTANPGEMIDLGTLGGAESQAADINDAGMVVGSATNANEQSRAFLFQDRNKNRIANPGEMIDLGTLGGAFSSADAVNKLGEVVGVAENGSFAIRGYYWKDKNRNRRSDPGEMIDLLSVLPQSSGWTELIPKSINDRGQVTGVGLFDGASRAFVLSLR